MPVVPPSALGLPADAVHTADSCFVDSNGRTLLLRGVNLSGSSKAPVGRPSQRLEGFWEEAEAGGRSFVGRPLNIDDGSADAHLARLRGWGFNMLRFPVTWEALEHEGPGKYDEEFMDYIVRVLRKCKEYGFKVYMDPHQDVWSRFTGGSGAPFWTLPACGINHRNITATQGALIHSEWPSPDAPDPAKFPSMIWGTNYARLVSWTVFTFFWAGRDFAPKCVIDGVNIQDYLQSHYIEAFGRLADKIAAAGDLNDTCVIGWDSMNEPHHGLLGHANLNEHSEGGTSQLKKGTKPTPIQALRLGMGTAQKLENWAFGSFGPKRDGSVVVDPKGARLWAEASTEPGGVHPRWGWKRDPQWELGGCPWALHGAWDVDTGEVLVPDYFLSKPGEAGQPLHYIADYWRPHWYAWAARIRRAHKHAIHFVAPPVFEQPPPLDEDALAGRACYSTHYYDGLTLITRHWNWFNADALGVLRGRYKSPALAVKIGESAIRKSIQEQLGELKSDADILGAYPTIIGEIGIPFDMDSKRAYGYTDGGKYKGDYSSQVRALDASMNASDGPNALNYTIWTYCPDSTHEWGDGWNLEDLSLWSPDDLRTQAKEETMMRAPDSSMLTLSAGSTKGPSKPWMTSASASTLSLATLSLGGRPGAATETPQAWRGLYDFLTDGARAVKAFCRPYPIATVGSPVNIQFDINKATFKMTVRVRAEDAPQLASTPSSPALSSASSSSSPQDDPKDQVPTEIYVPIVHFARRVRQGDSDESYDPDSAPASTASTRPASMVASDSLGASYASAASSSTLIPREIAHLALDVKVSAGRWEVDGQRLRWWYPVPAEGEPDAEYEIEIRRTGGAIKSAKSGLKAHWLQQVCEQVCCGDSCTIM